MRTDTPASHVAEQADQSLSVPLQWGLAVDVVIVVVAFVVVRSDGTDHAAITIGDFRK